MKAFILNGRTVNREESCEHLGFVFSTMSMAYGLAQLVLTVEKCIATSMGFSASFYPSITLTALRTPSVTCFEVCQ